MKWQNTKMILAGPGTGKTTKVVNEFLKGRTSFDDVLILSFTNATIKDLLKSFSDNGLVISKSNCMTLHQYALKINFMTNRNHILNEEEEKCFEMYSKKTGINIKDFHYFFDCLSFEEMIINCSNFIKNNPEMAKNKIGGINLLIVDEYQDFNKNERDLINQISSLANETLILGDDDQSIYGFKNADPEGIIEINNDSDIAKLPHENVCFRCPQDVVSACSNMIKNNKYRVDKEWKISDKKPIDSIKFRQFRDESQANLFILESVKHILRTKSDSSIMVLSPTKHLLPNLVNNLDTNGIEYVNWFKPEMSYEEQIKIWLLRSIFSDKKLLNFLFLISNNFKRKNKTNDAALGIIHDGLQKGEDKEAILNKFLDLGITDSQTISYIKMTPTPEDFVSSKTEFSEFIDVLAEDADRNNRLECSSKNKESIEFKKGVVNLMTIHKSKGLQADYVFVIGLVEGILPNETRGIDSIESQRRELFVALSRVREKLFLISTIQIDKSIAHKFDISKLKFDFKTRNYYSGQTSLFINELKLDEKAYE